MKIYIVCANNSISQEAYQDYNQAKSFIENRSDKPVMVSPFRFESKENIYTIHDVMVK